MFADDIALLSNEISQAQELLSRVEKEAAKVGLHLNEKKTELMAFNYDDPVDVLTMNGNSVKNVLNFTSKIASNFCPHDYTHSGTLGYTRSRFYDVNLVSFKIAYHGLNEEIHSSPFLSKQIKTGGFRKCEVHCCNFKGFKVTSLQISAWPGFEPRPPA